jgi:hypothetical protein
MTIKAVIQIGSGMEVLSQKEYFITLRVVLSNRLTPIDSLHLVVGIPVKKLISSRVPDFAPSPQPCMNAYSMIITHSLPFPFRTRSHIGQLLASVFNDNPLQVMCSPITQASMLCV